MLIAENYNEALELAFLRPSQPVQFRVPIEPLPPRGLYSWSTTVIEGKDRMLVVSMRAA